MTRRELAKIYYDRNRKEIRRKQTEYAATDEARIVKKTSNARYRQENAEKIRQQRAKQRLTEKHKTVKIDYYKKNNHRFMFNNAKARAKVENLPFTIELSDVVIPQVCPILNIPIVQGNLKLKGSPSIDRIIPNLGYVKGNIQIIAWQANRVKSDATLDELISLGEWAKKQKRGR